MEKGPDDSESAERNEERLQQNDGESLLKTFQAFNPTLIGTEMDALRDTWLEAKAMWQTEVEQYEKLTKIQVNNKWRRVPNRNYFTPDGTVQDKSLFPYHDAYYLLLDAYDCLYPEGETLPIPDEAIRNQLFPPSTRRLQREDEAEVEGYLPNSSEALCLCFPDWASEYLHWPTNFVVKPRKDTWDDSWRHLQSYNRNPDYWFEKALQEIPKLPTVAPEREEISYGPTHLPRNRKERTSVLIKLLKHALSELQKDHNVAHAALQQLVLFQDMDDSQTFRQVLVVLGTEYKECDEECHIRFLDGLAPQPDHFCSDWTRLDMEVIPRLIADGLTYLTTDHASALAAFVRLSYETGNTFSFFDEEEEEDKDLTERQKSLLKKNLYMLRVVEAEDAEDGAGARRKEDGAPPGLVRGMVIGLGSRAVKERHNLEMLREQLQKSDQDATNSELCDLVERSMDSFYNCVRALVDIGEASIQRLQPTRRTMLLCSLIVRALVQAHLDPIHSAASCSPPTGYIGLESLELEAMRLISPKRYANSVTQATDRILREVERSKKEAQTSSAESRVDVVKGRLERFLQERPSGDVKDVVRDLFVRDMVSVQHAGCGYGDFLVWFGFQIQPYDSILFRDIHNHPSTEEEETEWDVDEENEELDLVGLKARHEFSLLGLLRAWHAPWSPASHHSFQPSFRKAVCTLAVCAHRLHMPSEMALRVFEFLPRDWWPDERKECWCWDCIVKDMGKRHQEKRLQRIGVVGEENEKRDSERVRSLAYCPGCSVAMYCCHAHRAYHFKESHKRECQIPPFRRLGPKEDALFAEVFGQEDIDHLPPNPDLDVEGDDDDGSWESIDSNEELEHETELSTTRIVTRFFEKSATALPPGGDF
jgi:hypothetical protein